MDAVKQQQGRKLVHTKNLAVQRLVLSGVNLASRSPVAQALGERDFLPTGGELVRPNIYGNHVSSSLPFEVNLARSYAKMRAAGQYRHLMARPGVGEKATAR